MAKYKKFYLIDFLIEPFQHAFKFSASLVFEHKQITAMFG